MSKQTEEKTISRVPIPDDIHDSMREYAADSGMTLNDAQNEAIQWFISFKRSTGESIFYLASPSDSPYRSIWIESTLCDRAKRLLKKDKNTLSRLVFSAFVYFLKDKGLIP